MSATDELRAMLDERCVEWNATKGPIGTVWTHWDAFNGYRISAMDNEDGTVEIFYKWDVTPEQAVEATLGPKITGDTSDGYHTFNELYHHRAVLFSVIVRDHPDMAWKSKMHHDGTMYDGMFIVGLDTPQGQATYHYDVDPYWDMFECRELDRAPEWDGHTPDDAIARIATIGRDAYDYYLGAKPMTEENMLTAGWERSRGTCENVTTNADKNHFECSECHCIVEDSENHYVEVFEVGKYLQGNTYGWNFCPNCGRRIEVGKRKERDS